MKKELLQKDGEIVNKIRLAKTQAFDGEIIDSILTFKEILKVSSKKIIKDNIDKNEIKYLKKIFNEFLSRIRKILILALENNNKIPLNKLQEIMECGFNKGTKIKNYIISSYFDNNGEIIVGVDEIKKIRI